MITKVKRIILAFFWVPLVTGYVGYCVLGGLTPVEGIYATIALYFVNPTSDLYNVFIYIAKYTAILITTTVVLDFLMSVLGYFDRWYNSLFSDSTAIYTDMEGELVTDLKSAFAHSMMVCNPRSVIRRAKRHIIMFDDDIASLDFYSSHEAEFAGKKVYLVAENIDSALLKVFDTPDVEFHYINRYDLMARDYWREHDLYESIVTDRSAPIRIAIIGYGHAGRALLRYGYMNNVYMPDQEIEYHIWGAAGYECRHLETLSESSMNHDSIVAHTEDAIEEIAFIATMDRVIIADTENKLEILQELLYADSELHIHYLSEGSLDLNRIYAADNLQVFGEMEKILTEDNIINEKLYRMGKLINYDYQLSESGGEYDEAQMEACWRAADGYGQESSIASADHYRIRSRLEKDHVLSDEELAQIEHIRWCRFMYSIHYVYGETRDKKKRRHPDLVEYITQEVAAKDSIRNPYIKTLLDS